MEGAEEDSNLLIQLGEPDAIFQPQADVTLREFLKEGKPEDAVRAFVSGFRGYPEMVNLLAQWTEDAGAPLEEIRGQLEKQVTERVKQVYDPQQTRSIFQEKTRNVP